MTLLQKASFTPEPRVHGEMVENDEESAAKEPFYRRVLCGEFLW